MVKNEYFTYEQNNYGFVLPVDYSVDELHKEWGEDPRALKKRLLQHSLLQETLYSLVAADGSEKEEPGRKNGKTPLPIEAEPFLKCFFDLASKSEYKPLFDKDDRPKLKNKFSSQLCQNLAQKILPQNSDNGSEPAAFCRRALFQNEGFDAIVIKQQWEDRIKERLELIQKLSKTAPVEVQAQALQDCLMVLDRIALDLSRSQKTSDSQQTPLPKELLTALLSERHKVNPQKKGYTAYKIRNIRIPSNPADNTIAQTLQEAFSDLCVSKSRDADLLKRARICYLDDLTSQIDPSAFERQYLQLNEYLRLANTELNEQRLVSAIKSACIPTLQQCCNPSNYKEIPITPAVDVLNKYADVFLMRAAKVNLDWGIGLFNTAKELLHTANATHLFWEQLVAKMCVHSKEKLNQMEISYRMHVQRNMIGTFSEWFAKTWAYTHQEKFNPEKIEFWPKYVDSTKQEFCLQGQEAADYFGMQTAFANRVAQIQCDKQLYGAMDDEIAEVYDINIAFLAGSFQILRCIVEDTAALIADGIKYFQQIKRT